MHKQAQRREVGEGHGCVQAILAGQVERRRLEQALKTGEGRILRPLCSTIPSRDRQHTPGAFRKRPSTQSR